MNGEKRQRRAARATNAPQPSPLGDGAAAGAQLTRKRALAAAAVLAVAGLLTYGNTFNSPFIFDDDRCIVWNEQIRRLFPLRDILTARPESRPVINLSLAINYAISGYEVWSYHALNLAVHILASMALFGVVRRTVVSRRFGDDIHRAATPLALVAALLWLVHPLQTAAVTYTIQRAESLMGLLYLLTLYCAIRSFSTSARMRFFWCAAAIIACAAGMGSKQVMITAPLMVLLYDRIFASRSLAQALRRHWLLYLGLVAGWLVLLKSIPLAFEDATAGFGMKTMSSWEYARSQFGVILHYLRLSVWPVGLCFDYRWPVARSMWRILPHAVAIAAILVLTAWALRKRPAAGFLGVWFFGILSVSSTIIPITDLAVEHRMYLSLAAVICLLVVGGYALSLRVLGRDGAAGSRRRSLRHLMVMAPVAIAVATLGYLTYARNDLYRTAAPIWLDVTRKRPDNSRAHYNLGNCYKLADENEKAIDSYEQAIRLRPDHAEAHYGLASVFSKLGRNEQAIRHYELAVKHEEMLWTRTNLARVYNGLGIAHARLKRFDEAAACYRRAIDIRPDYAGAHYNLGNVMYKRGRYDEAIRHYETAITNRRTLESDENLARIYNNLAHIYTRLDRPDKAAVYYRLTIEIDADNHSAMNNLAWVLATHPDDKIRNGPEAVRLAERVCAATGYAQPACLDTLAAAYAEIGQFDKAVEVARKALQLATDEGNGKQIRQFESNLKLYRRHKPMRD